MSSSGTSPTGQYCTDYASGLNDAISIKEKDKLQTDIIISCSLLETTKSRFSLNVRFTKLFGVGFTRDGTVWLEPCDTVMCVACGLITDNSPMCLN